MQTPTHLHFRFLIGIIRLISASHPHAYAVPEARRNIVFVFCDGLSYGEIQALNPERGKIPAPAANTLADEGIIFTDAHSGSSVCTPTRYGLMTGRYSWRTWLQRGVVKGFEPK